ncbi:hypothetical protein GGR54DRAFT_595579, partial [Hypoxylon sp. NC1633]
MNLTATSLLHFCFPSRALQSLACISQHSGSLFSVSSLPTRDLYCSGEKTTKTPCLYPYVPLTKFVGFQFAIQRVQPSDPFENQCGRLATPIV